jgi:hypothetical protein
MFLAELSDAVLEVVNAAEGTVDQPGAKHDQTKVQGQEGNQQGHYLGEAVITRRRDKDTQHRERQSKHRDTGAQSRERSSFLSEKHLDFAKDDIV